MSIVDTTTLNAPAADVTLTPAHSGRTFMYTKAGANRTLNLPSPLNAQLYYRIINKSATGGNTLIVTPPAGTLVTQWRQINGTNAAGTGKNTITFASTAIEGDTLELISDGASWYAYASTGAAAAGGFVVLPP